MALETSPVRRRLHLHAAREFPSPALLGRWVSAPDRVYINPDIMRHPSCTLYAVRQSIASTDPEANYRQHVRAYTPGTPEYAERVYNERAQQPGTPENAERLKRQAEEEEIHKAARE